MAASRLALLCPSLSPKKPRSARLFHTKFKQNPRPTSHEKPATSPGKIRVPHLTSWRGLRLIEDPLRAGVGIRKTSTRPGRKERATVRSNRWRAPRTGHVSHVLKRTTCPREQSLPPGVSTLG